MAARPRLLLAALAVGLARGQSITAAEKQAVGSALTKALGVMSGQVQSGSKMEICMGMFPDGAPANPAKDPTWQSCKDLVPSGRTRSALISKRKQPLTGSQRAEIAHALGDALSVMSGKKESQSAYDSCMSLFPHGKPADGSEKGPWQACEHVLQGALMQKAVKILRAAQPLSAQEKKSVGDALTSALRSIQGKNDGQDLFGTCNDMFPDGKRPADMKETDVMWVACKNQVYVPPAAASLVKVGVKQHSK